MTVIVRFSGLALSFARGVKRHWFAAPMVFCIALLAACSGGGASNTTTVATLPPSISTQPESQSVLVGTSASFNVSATGDGLSYQWQLSTDAGHTWANVPLATSTRYAIAAVASSMDGQQFRVVVTGPAGTQTS